MQQNKPKQEFNIQSSSTRNVNKINMVEVKNEGMIVRNNQNKHDACYDFYGTKIALGSSDGFIEIQEFNLNSFKSEQKEIITYKIDFQHKGPVWQLSWSNPKYGSILASCSFDKTICLFKEMKPRYSKLLQFNENQESVMTIAWSYTKLILAAGVADGSVHIYQRQKGGQMNRETDWKHLQLSKHKQCVNQVSWIRGKDLDFASCSNDETIIIWKVIIPVEGTVELNSQTQIQCNGWVRSVDWAAEQFKQFQLLAAGLESNCVTIFYFDQDYNEKDVYKIQAKGPCWKVQWSPLGNQIAICTLDDKSDPFVGVYRQLQTGDFVEI